MAREYFLEDVLHPKGGIWIKCKNDKDCVFCDHCTDVYWDYTHLIYAVSCEENHDPNDRPCKYFKEEKGEADAENQAYNQIVYINHTKHHPT